MFQGDNLRVQAVGEAAEGLVELCFDRRGDAINKLDAHTIDEFRHALAAIAAGVAEGRVRGMLLTSAKDVFIVGADITEFGAMFRKSAAEIALQTAASNQVMNAFEDLGVPSVVAINGYALGGGLELCLAAAQRVMATTGAMVGLPEVKLGLFPGFGGTVRLPRVAGPLCGIEWIAGGQPSGAQAALALGVVDAVAAPAELRAAAMDRLRRCVAGEIDWRAAQQRKRAPVAMPAAECAALFDTQLALWQRRAAKHQPAAAMAIAMMARAAGADRAGALALEAEAFGQVCKTPAAAGLVQTFLNEQALKKLQRRQAQGAVPVAQAAVIGAGLMGAGIAFSTARAGLAVRLKDLRPQALDQAHGEAARLLDRQVQQGKLKRDKADAVLARLQPQAGDEGFSEADLVIEAIVERLDAKRTLLAALEPRLLPEALVASNTSSLRIADLATALQRPERLVGLHFFNPVPAMPLVEVVRGPATAPAAVASAVAYVQALRKTPVVVADVPGFLVNRLLTPYVNAFLALLAEGADFERVDAAMEAFGWPMGPAWLQDVVGMDTGLPVGEQISAAYADRMPPVERHAVRLMVQHGRLGQKNGAGFYRHDTDDKGRPRKTSDPAARALVATLQPDGPRDFTEAEIVERLMAPLLHEAVRCLDEAVVGTAAELDMALLLGTGFPAWTGGPLKWIDQQGAAAVLAQAERLAAHGPMYAAPMLLRTMAAAGQTFYPV